MNKNVKSLTLNAQTVKKPGQVKSGQDEGYHFQAKAGYRLKYNLTGGACAAFYTPNNHLLRSEEFTKLPIGGTYTVQIFIPSGSSTYELALSLEDPTQASILSDPTLSSPANRSPSPKPSVVSRTCAERADDEFYRQHPSRQGKTISQDNYDLAKEWLAIRNSLPDCPLAAPNLEGSWSGTYDGESRVLRITQQKLDNTFKGTLTTSGTYEIAIEGEIDPETNKITIREVKVISEYSKGAWALGVNSGKLSVDLRHMQGTGEDTRKDKYSWSFSR